MAEIKADLTGKTITVETRRELLGFVVDAEAETVTVSYREVQYTGKIGEAEYKEMSRINKNYNSDFNAWMASDAGQQIKAAVEASLSQDDPNT